MLEKIIIRNYQKHSRLIIDFDPAITTIVGGSDTGKSAIIRALVWVTKNTPGGSSFIRHGTKGAVVQATIDGHVITRRRGGNKNTYNLDGQELRAFGTGVPTQIEGITNLGAENYQQQHDPPFWFCDSAGQVSRNLNSVVDLNIIDETTSTILGQVRQEASRLEAAKEIQMSAAATVDGLAWVPAAESEYADMLADQHAATEKNDMATTLSAQIRTANDTQKRMSQAATTATTLADITMALRWVDIVMHTAADSAAAATRLEMVVETIHCAIETATRTDVLATEAVAAEKKMLAMGCPLCGK